MTIAGWFLFGVLAIVTSIITGFAYKTYEKKRYIVIGIIIILIALGGLLFYFNGTAAGKRDIIDQKSNISGIERIINIYTANGGLLASYKGKIDIAENDGGYIKFDFDGKRYIYYNCFVETIAQIE